jgi:hypothetical protein
MLLIWPAVRTDVHLLKTLIHEMGEYERLPVLITEETLARKVTQRAGAVRIAGGQAEVDPFFHRILSRDGCNRLKGPNPHLKTSGVPSPEHSAGANQERDASFQAHDQCRRELCLGHPCGQVPS